MSAVIQQNDLQKLSPRERQLAALRPFKPGDEWKGNAGGKPTAARNRIQGDFLNALAADFEKNGKKAIADCREKDPTAYVKVVASLMPKQIDMRSNLDELADEQLTSAITAVRAILIAEYTREGTGEAEGAEPLKELSALPETK